MDASDALAPPDARGWDLLVVGGGTAGIVAATTAAHLGAAALLVERDRTGGDCLWTGCVPSKTLLAAAHAAADARAATSYGITAQVTVDFAAVQVSVQRAIRAIEPADSPAVLRAAGVRVAQGSVRFTAPDAVDVDGVSVRFRNALIATGSEPVVPVIPGLSDASPLTSDSVWQLTELPGRLLVLGGGTIGCELGQAFARLGSAVTILESGARLLEHEDADASACVAEALRSDGVQMLTEVTVTRFEEGRTAVCDDGTRVDFDRVLVAAGRRARIEGLGVDVAGVLLDASGFVRVSSRLQTANPRVWAAGDVTANPPFTHTAGVHASLAATNAVLGLRRQVDVRTNPRVTFTQPEVAAFGATAEQGKRRGSVWTIQHDDVDRAITEGRTNGFTRLVLDHRSRIVGATIVGPRAGESIAELVLAARSGLRARDIAGTTHAYPTYSDGVWKASLAHVTARLDGSAVRRALALLRAIRRSRSA